jgi:hypothetical protein
MVGGVDKNLFADEACCWLLSGILPIDRYRSINALGGPQTGQTDHLRHKSFKVKQS